MLTFGYVLFVLNVVMLVINLALGSFLFAGISALGVAFSYGIISDNR